MPVAERERQQNVLAGLFLVDCLNALIGLTLRRRALSLPQLESGIMDAWPTRLGKPPSDHIGKRLRYLSDRYGAVAKIEQAGTSMYGLTEEGRNLFDLAAQIVQRGMETATAMGITHEAYREQHPITSQFPDV